MQMTSTRARSPGGGITGLAVELVEAGWTVARAGSVAPSHDVPVPGNVRIALVNAGIIPDPFIGQNNEASKWVSDVEWIYRNKVAVPSIDHPVLRDHPDGGLFHLVFDAIDYDATFSIDGTRVCRQTGMFSPVDIVTGILPGDPRAGGDASIEVRFHVQPWWRTHAVKSQMAFGWDFAPEIRTVGIWKPVRSHLTGPACFSDAFVSATPVDPHHPSLVHVSARCVIDVIEPASMARVVDPTPVHVSFTVGGATREMDVSCHPGRSFTLDFGEIEIPPWQPWSLGEQPRVPVTLRVHWKGVLSDEFRGVVVNRQVRWLTNPGTLPRNENWTFTINNQKLFLRGINWVPPDSIYGRINAARYKSLIDAAIDARIDMLRVWGGGIEEKPEFYEYCDTTGMMVWQEFPFACTNYPKDPRYVRIVQHEIEGIVTRTRRHPSVVVYCGGNEFNPFINAHVVSVASNAVATHAPGIHFFKASPFSGDDHNWRVFGKRPLLRAYDINQLGPYKMLTEFGVQAAPSLPTLASCSRHDLTTASIDELAGDLRYHKADVGLLQAFARQFSQAITDAKSLVRVSQAIQAYALKYAIEACRAGWPNVSGVFPWQLSDPWPNVSWSIIDHDLRPKLATRFVQRAYAPVLPMVRSWRRVLGSKDRREGDVIVHNATQAPFTGSLVLDIARRDGSRGDTIASSRVERVRVAPGRSIKAGTVTVDDAPGIVVRLRLIDDGGVHVAGNFHFPAMEPDRSLATRIGDTVNARFDGWWRRYMTRLMDVERRREEFKAWTKEKRNRGRDPTTHTVPSDDHA